MNLGMVVPEYTFKMQKYKSKLLDQEVSLETAISPDVSKQIDSYILKSEELNNRVRLREKTMASKPDQKKFEETEEISEMLIDSILYKVKLLKNL